MKEAVQQIGIPVSVDRLNRNFAACIQEVQGDDIIKVNAFGSGVGLSLSIETLLARIPKFFPRLQLGVIVCSGPCATLGEGTTGDSSVDGFPGSPATHADFTDNRYWVKLQRITNNGGSSCDKISLGDYPSTDRRFGAIVAATNLFEANCATHSVRPGTPVVLDFEWDNSKPRVKRWFLRVADEGTCASGPCSTSTSSSSSSSYSSSSSSSKSSASSASSPSSGSSSGSSASSGACCSTYTVVIAGGLNPGTFALAQNAYFPDIWEGDGWTLTTSSSHGNNWTIYDGGDVLVAFGSGGQPCPPTASVWTDINTTGVSLVNIVCGNLPSSSSGSSGSSGSAGSSAGSSGSAGSAGSASGDSCPPGWKQQKVLVSQDGCTLTSMTMCYDPEHVKFI